MVHEIRGTKINPKSSFKNWGGGVKYAGAEITGANMVHWEQGAKGDIWG